ncbi:hypothetical protein SAPIO_CDS1017 [Scedosporium apiospermum]|uniref:Uncharacterized protein n=1 Tax=Pseudallescheria apiosperma TaxID=563466 RepID=A0A084GFN8_PSEDA|nr:uncharacterized protein SAPIO_CDS1017 [Scedosporium apiospermum]KEZ46150.1 hypothetical protein SAPIO_CDS1017 [Scedosporium apiospermum]
MSTPSAIPAPATGATPASNTTDETTPLLSGNADDNGINDASAAEAQEPGPSSPAAIQASILRSAVLPTWILLIASSITLILSIALFILNGFWPSGYYQGYWLDYWKPVAVSAFFSAFLAIVNLYSIRASKPPGILFNILVHLVLGFVAINTVTMAGSELDPSRPRCTDGDDECFRFRLAWLIVMSATFISGVVFSWLTHPGLLIFWFIKARNAYGNPGRRQWTVPAGVLTFEFSIKFLRQTPDGSVPPVLPATQESQVA